MSRFGAKRGVAVGAVKAEVESDMAMKVVSETATADLMLVTTSI